MTAAVNAEIFFGVASACHAQVQTQRSRTCARRLIRGNVSFSINQAPARSGLVPDRLSNVTQHQAASLRLLSVSMSDCSRMRVRTLSYLRFSFHEIATLTLQNEPECVQLCCMLGGLGCFPSSTLLPFVPHECYSGVTCAGYINRLWPAGCCSAGHAPHGHKRVSPCQPVCTHALVGEMNTTHPKKLNMGLGGTQGHATHSPVPVPEGRAGLLTGTHRTCPRPPYPRR